MGSRFLKSSLLCAMLGAIAFLLTSCSSPDSETASVSNNPILFQGMRLIVGDGEVIENAALLIEGDLIRQVGDAGEIEVSEGTTIVDLEGKTIIPAMVDAHAHLGYEAYSSWGGDNYSRENLANHLDRYAYYGFAAVFSAGSDPDDFALQFRESQLAGDIGGARFVFAAGMAPPGQGPNDQFLGHALAVEERTGMTVLRGAGSVGQAREAVREVADKGIGVIKIWVDDRGGSQQKLEPVIYQAIIEEARSHDIKVFVHQQFTEDMPDLIDAGVSGFLHGRIGVAMDDDLVNQMQQADVFVIPNLGLGELRRERVADDPFLQEAVAADVVTRLGSSFDARRVTASANVAAEQELRQGFMRLVNADVDIILGTDAGAVPDHYFGYTGHRELEIFVRLGMTPMQALIAATSKPAERLGLDDIGSLVAGKSADFVVLDANPLEDIRNTRSISDVYLRGGKLDRQVMGQRFTAVN